MFDFLLFSLKIALNTVPRLLSVFLYTSNIMHQSGRLWFRKDNAELK